MTKVVKDGQEVIACQPVNLTYQADGNVGIGTPEQVKWDASAPLERIRVSMNPRPAPSKLSESKARKFRHYCPDWDFMQIDRHDAEFTSCTCVFSDIPRVLEVLEDLKGYSGVGTDGNPYDTSSWNAALDAVKQTLRDRNVF
jgi:hypothetical protein